MRRLAGAALLVAALAAPEAARAAGNVTASFSQGILSITGDDEAQTLTVGLDASNNITVTHDGAPVTITGGTPTTANTSLVTVTAFGGADSVTLSTRLSGGPSEPDGQPEVELQVDGGSGNDTIVFMGGTAPDNIAVGELGGGDAGINTNSIGDGDGDDVRSNAETVQLDLGSGGDSVRSAPVFLGPVNRTLVVNGGLGNDSIDGGIGMSILNGNEDNDSIGVLGGSNLVDGGAGMNTGFVFLNQVLDVSQNGGVLNLSGSTLSGNLTQLGDLVVFGSSGNDTLNAGSVALPMTVLGGNGNDKVTAGSGDDDLFGDPGDDELRGQGGTDNVNGGDGNDSCEGESLTLCEILIVDPVPGGGQPGGGNPPGSVPNPFLPTPNPLLETNFFRPFVREAQTEGINGILGANGFRVPFNAVPGSYGFSLRAAIRQIQESARAGPSQRGRQVVLAKATKRVTTAGRTRVKLKLTRQGRKALRRARRAPVTLRVQYTSPAGERFTASRRFTLKRKRR